MYCEYTFFLKTNYYIKLKIVNLRRLNNYVSVQARSQTYYSGGQNKF